MANAEHLKILNQGREAWNAWRKDYPSRKPEKDDWTESDRLHWMETDSTIPDLNEANLSQKNLQGYQLSQMRICRANLSGADLRETDIAGALLRNSDLSGANLFRSNLGHVDLQEANLTGAKMRYCQFNSGLADWAA